MKRLIVLLTVALGIVVVPASWAATPSADPLVATLVQQAPGLRSDVLRLALDAENNAAQQGLVTKQNLLTIIDYSMPSTQPRLFVFDLVARRLLFRELVAHG